MEFVQYLLYLVILGCVFSAAGFLLSLSRARRRSDAGTRVLLLFTGIVSVTGLVCVLIFF
jgi:hypothetical protein